jgi:Icc-related predicted phosphoesterase
MASLLFATDLHGNTGAYEALLRRAADERVDAVVLGGDLLPLPDGLTDPLGPQQRFVRGRLRPLFEAFRARRPDTRLFAILGNDDWAVCEEEFDAMEQEGIAVPLHLRVHALDAASWIAGYSCVPVTPFSMSDYDRYEWPGWRPPALPRRILLSGPEGLREGSAEELEARPTIQEDLRALAALSDPARTVYVVHSPPHGTKLDVMFGGVSIGSRALRAFIERYEPPLTLHGHIHESPRLSGAFFDRLGRTVSVNPGDSRMGLRAVYVETTDPAGSIRLVGD